MNENNNWLRMMEMPVEKKWCWWTLAREPGHWVYLISNQTDQVIAKIFIWRWECNCND